MEQMLHDHFLRVFATAPARPHGLDLAAIGYVPADLPSIDGPFTEEEVWCAIKELPADRAPRPDGFTGAFYKAAWPVIKGEIMAALHKFFDGRGEGLDKLNNGLIVLFPKKDVAACPRDYRPIAMVHSFGKLVYKILANRLAPLLPGLVSCNQMAFTRGRTMHDSYKFMQSLAAEYRRKKISRLLLKIDISKAFDTLSWAFLLEVLESVGFSARASPLPRAAVHDVVDAVHRRLPNCLGPLMTRSGRLVWIKSVLMAMPVFAMMANKLPTWAREEIEAMCRRYLWAGSDQSVRGKCLVAWPVVTRPTRFGGLGIPNLKLVNQALQARWLWLQRFSEDRICSGLPISVAAEVREFFEASITVMVGDGSRTSFWHNRWVQGQAIKDFAAALLAAVPKRIANSLTVAEGLSDRAWTRGIAGGITLAVIEDYVALWAILDSVVLREGVEDKVIWCWTPDGQYSAKSAYLMLHQGSVVFAGHDLIWKSWLPLRIKFFLWLAARCRLWTSDRRRRHGLDTREACFLCDDAPETIDHLLVSCKTSRSVWTAVLGACGLRPAGADSCSLLE
ncbi:hypothetical protein U9M48_038957 [Paspalum notatum var. saurae]|uniref:Reverse transcriptase domain-containing protein n=1 Tax=Paspalum notatum var. saurae TaxID=547442 RepID=A0AAQ3UMX2_PASNO